MDGNMVEAGQPLHLSKRTISNKALKKWGKTLRKSGTLLSQEASTPEISYKTRQGNNQQGPVAHNDQHKLFQ
jgi:hypothetical protein